MLTKLLPDQVSDHWDIISYAVEQSLPPIAGESPDKMNKILSSLLMGKSHCWASYTVGESKRVFEGIVITRIQHDDVSDTRNLLIYCLYGYEGVDRKSWIDGFKTLVKFAESKNCDRITGYTKEPLIIRKVEQLGGEADYTFISLPL